MPDKSLPDPPRVAARKRAGKLTQPADVRGVPDSGRIVKLFVGQGHGVIRTGRGREIYFHRADIQDGISINDFAIGDAVSFERLEDAISGARALDVARRSATR